jgi:hypothetical protein
MPPPDFVHPDWPEVAEFLVFAWQLCHEYNGSVTSGCRTSLRNANVGGHRDSKHTWRGGWGMAVDIVFDTALECEAAKREVDSIPEVYWYQGPDYHPTRLHVQGWAVGEWPRVRRRR